MRLTQIRNIFLAIVVSLSAGWLAQVAHDNNATCSERAVDAVLAGGDLVLSDCSLTFDAPKVITGNVTITGGTFTGKGGVLFLVKGGALFTLADSMLDGDSHPLIVAEGGEAVLHNVVINGSDQAVVNQGTFTGVDTLLRDFACDSCSGAAFINQGKAVFMRSFFRNNVVTAPDDWREKQLPVIGGAIYNEGYLVVAHSRFVENQALFGGAIANRGGFLLAQDSTFVGNRNVDDQVGGGAILNLNGRAIIQRGKFEKNLGGITGGALLNRGHLTVEQAIFQDNGCISSQCFYNTLYHHEGDIAAMNNYWGRESGPNQRMTNIPKSAYTPFLEELPAWAQ